MGRGRRTDERHILAGDILVQRINSYLIHAVLTQRSWAQ